MPQTGTNGGTREGSTMKQLTLAEAAQFLRMSSSSLYQRKDILR